jgi:hypothetical protein
MTMGVIKPGTVLKVGSTQSATANRVVLVDFGSLACAPKGEGFPRRNERGIFRVRAEDITATLERTP